MHAALLAHNGGKTRGSVRFRCTLCRVRATCGPSVRLVLKHTQLREPASLFADVWSGRVRRPCAGHAGSAPVIVWRPRADHALAAPTVRWPCSRYGRMVVLDEGTGFEAAMRWQFTGDNQMPVGHRTRTTTVESAIFLISLAVPRTY